MNSLKRVPGALKRYMNVLVFSVIPKSAWMYTSYGHNIPELEVNKRYQSSLEIFKHVLKVDIRLSYFYYSLDDKEIHNTCKVKHITNLKRDISE